MLFLNVLWNVVLPIFLIIGLGVLLQRKVHLEPQALSRAVFYLFSPCLAFAGLYSLNLNGDGLGPAVLFALIMALFMTVLGLLMARLGRYSRTYTSATLLTLLNSNMGNYGLPLNQFAFGTPGLQIAILYFVMNATMANSVGVYVASAGRANALQSLKNVSRTPLVYATLLALLFNWRHWPVPEPVFKAISLSGQAAVPVMLVILGIHLGRLGGHIHWRRTLPVTAVKLLVGPAFAWGLTGLLGMSGLLRAVTIVQASTPTAVMSTVLSTEFDCEPEYVSEVVFVTTLASILTLTTVVALVQTWII